MTKRERGALGLLAALLWAAPAAASIPGNIEQVTREGLLHVCKDREPGDADYLVCEDVDAGFPETPYTASECVAAGLSSRCRIDFIPDVKVRARLSLVYDDQALTSAFDTQEQTAVRLRLVLGDDRIVLFDLFEGTKLGNWNPMFAETNVFEAFDFTNADATAYQFAYGNLADLGEAIVAAADDFFAADLSDTVPVLVKATKLVSSDDSSHDAFDDPLASSGDWALTFKFARVRP